MVMPSPVQERAHATIRRAIEVAVEIIDERGEAGMRLQDVVDRSGVSAGSLTHHFGSREGLIAAALMERYDRAAQQRARSFELDTSDPGRFAAGMAGMLASSAAGERDGWRLARLRALAYARHRPQLRASLATSMMALEQDMATRVAVAGPRLIDGGPFNPRALVVFSESYSAGRLVDTLFGEPLPFEDWAALFARLVRSVVPAPVVEDALGTEREQDRTDAFAALALPPAARPAIPRLRLSEDERRMLEAAAAHQYTDGVDSLKVRELVARTGLSRSWFARHFGEREDVLDHLHLFNLVGFSGTESAVFEEAFDAASDAPDLIRRLHDVVALMSEPDAIWSAWNRLDLIAAAIARPRLAEQAAPVVHATIGRIAAAISGGQARGLVHRDVPPTAAARFLWAAPLAFVLGEVVGVEWPELAGLAERAGRTLVVTGD